MTRKVGRPKEEEIMIWAGVIAQLHRTLAGKALSGSKLPYPLFVLLRHFAHNVEREWTVGELSNAFQTEQPGITKQVQKLHALKLVATRPDPEDARRKLIRISKRGLTVLADLSEDIRELDRSIFSGWPKARVDQLHADLQKLKTYLDENR